MNNLLNIFMTKPMFKGIYRCYLLGVLAIKGKYVLLHSVILVTVLIVYTCVSD